MVKQKIFFIAFVSCYLLLAPRYSPIYAQVSRLGQAIEKYAQGKLEEAIPDFESALSEDKGNKKIEMYLVNCLVAVGTKYLKEQNYNKAYPYLERATQLVPQDKEVKEIYQIVKTKITPSVVTQPPAVPPQAPVVVPQRPVEVPQPPVVKKVKPVKEKMVVAPKVEVVKPLVKKEETKPTPAVVTQPPAVAPQPPAIIPQPPAVVTQPPAVVPQPPAPVVTVAKPPVVAQPLPEDFEKKVELVIARFEKQREELLAHLSEWEKMIKKEKEYLSVERKVTMQRTILIVGLILLSFTFFILLPVYRTARESAEVRDKVLNEFKDKITKIVEKEKDALREFITQEAGFFSQSLQGSLTKFKREFTEIENKEKEKIVQQPPTAPPQAPAVVPQPPAPRPESGQVVVPQVPVSRPELEQEAIPRLAEMFISSEEIMEDVTPDLRLDAIEVIEKNLKSDDPIERLVAARLLESFLSDRNELIQIRAIKCLKKYVPEKVFDSLKEMTQKKKKISSQVMRMIDDLPLKEANEILYSLLEHPDPNIRKKAANILARLSEEARKFSS